MASYDTIKHNVSIGTVLRKYGFRVPGRETYRIPCPIHGGGDANFSVSERDGLWNCFSVCGRGGSVIDLVAALEKIEISAAAYKLANDFDLSPEQTERVVARATIHKVEQWKAMKKESPEVEMPETIELEEGYRNLTRKTIDFWGLKRVPIRTIIVGGLGNDIDPLDQYKHIGTPTGVLIPLYNARGEVCSYSIRKDTGEPKYFNAVGVSKAYPFGLYKNCADIIDEGFCWLVEGQFDCIGLWQRGYKNCMALMGSSLSEQQAMLLLTVTSKLMLLMDGDNAGRKAAKSIKKRWDSVFDIGIYELSEGVDPAEYDGKLEI